MLQGDVLACHNSLWTAFGLQFCSTTLVETWIVMALIAVLALLAARGARAGRPGRLQNIFELALDFVAGFVGGSQEVGPEHPARSRRLLFEYLATLLLFIFVANMLDVIPPYIAPTNTLNTTLALALVTFLFTHLSGVARRGLRYGGNFLHSPGIAGWVLLPLALIEELSKPLTLSFRLFGNIFAGELMLVVVMQLIPLRWYYFVGGFIPHLVWLLFSIFVGAVQSLIFMLLSLAYVSQATAVPEHH